MIKGSLQNNNIENSDVAASKDCTNETAASCEVNKAINDTEINSQNTKSGKIFEKLTVKDIVFLAIIGAVLIVTCSVMAFVSGFTLTIFAIGQVATALQMSLFITIGLIKVRKPFAMTFIMLFMGAIMVMMSPVMFLSNIIVMLVIETFIILVFRGYKSNIACVVAGFLAGPLSIITPTVYNVVVATQGYTALDNIVMAVVMTLVVVALSIVGSLIGYKVGTELEKSASQSQRQDQV